MLIFSFELLNEVDVVLDGEEFWAAEVYLVLLALEYFADGWSGVVELQPVHVVQELRLLPNVLRDVVVRIVHVLLQNAQVQLVELIILFVLLAVLQEILQILEVVFLQSPLLVADQLLPLLDHFVFVDCDQLAIVCDFLILQLIQFLHELPFCSTICFSLHPLLALELGNGLLDGLKKLILEFADLHLGHVLHHVSVELEVLVLQRLLMAVYYLIQQI